MGKRSVSLTAAILTSFIASRAFAAWYDPQTWFGWWPKPFHNNLAGIGRVAQPETAVDQAGSVLRGLRTYDAAQFGETVPSWTGAPLPASCAFGQCGSGSAAVEYAFGAAGMKTLTFQMNSVSPEMASHAVNIVSVGNKTYLVDLTPAQFAPPQSGSPAYEIYQQLVAKGYAQLEGSLPAAVYSNGRSTNSAIPLSSFVAGARGNVAPNLGTHLNSHLSKFELLHFAEQGGYHPTSTRMFVPTGDRIYVTQAGRYQLGIEAQELFADVSRAGRFFRSPGMRTAGRVLGRGAQFAGYAGDAYNVGYIAYVHGQTAADTLRDVANTYQTVEQNPGQTYLDEMVASGLDNSGFYTTLSKNIHAGTLRRRDIHEGDRWLYNPWNWFFGP